MNLAIVLSSILAITGAVWLLDKILPFKICPICAGVSLTWFWLLAGIWLGWLPAADYQMLAAILMGGSVVGIVYQLEKHLPAGNFPLLRKALFVAAGFAAVYEIINFRWVLAGIFAAGLLAVWILFFRKPKEDKSGNTKVKALEEQMKKCC